MKWWILWLAGLLALCSCGNNAPAENCPLTDPLPPPSLLQPDSATALHRGYGRSGLSVPLQLIYDQLVEAAQSMAVDEILPCPTNPAIDTQQIQAVIDCFTHDNPGFFWAQPQLLQQGSSLYIQLTANRSLSEIQRCQQQLESAAHQLLQNVAGSPFQQAVAIHDRLIRQVKYDRSASLPDIDNAYGALVGGKAICDGFAKAYQYLLNRQGIDSVYLQGTSKRGIAHGWNGVNLQGQWYYVDVTWDAAVSSDNYVSHQYLLIGQQEMLLQRSWNSNQYPALPPPETTPSCYYSSMGYSVDRAESIPQQLQLLAGALSQQLCALYPLPSNTPLLEVKVTASQEQYWEIKKLFIKNIYQIAREMEQLAAQAGWQLEISPSDLLECNFNDPMQIIFLQPVIAQLTPTTA